MPISEFDSFISENILIFSKFLQFYIFHFFGKMEKLIKSKF